MAISHPPIDSSSSHTLPPTLFGHLVRYISFVHQLSMQPEDLWPEFFYTRVVWTGETAPYAVPYCARFCTFY